MTTVINSVRTAALVVFLLAPAAEAISLRTIVHGPQPAAPAPGKVRARAVEGERRSIERDISVPGDVSLELPPGIWELTVQSSMYWSRPKYVSGKEAVTIDLWPVATLEGTVKGVESAPPSVIRVAFEPSEAERGARPSPSGEATCSIEGEKWNCLLPAGVYDLRFGSPGYASMFRWNVRAEAGVPTRIGSLSLVRGPSLFGYVVAHDGIECDMKDVRVTAVPRVKGGQVRSAYTATPNARGFFQLTGIPPGDYLVAARGKGIRAESRPARVLKDLNAELRSPLILDRPKTISVTLTPPVAPDGSGWRVSLLLHDSDARRLDELVTKEAASAGGAWKHEAVAGTYLLEIAEKDESVWWSEDVQVSADDVSRDIALPSLMVSGSVKLGDRPLAARILFGARMGPRQKTLLADDDGKFSGMIPGKPDDSDVWDIGVEADVPRVQRTLERVKGTRGQDGETRFEIELPATGISGRILNDDGTPEPHALVSLQPNDASEFQQVFGNAHGGYELFGLPNGKYRIQAESHPKTSGVVPNRDRRRPESDDRPGATG